MTMQELIQKLEREEGFRFSVIANASGGCGCTTACTFWLTLRDESGVLVAEMEGRPAFLLQRAREHMADARRKRTDVTLLDIGGNHDLDHDKEVPGRGPEARAAHRAPANFRG